MPKLVQMNLIFAATVQKNLVQMILEVETSLEITVKAAKGQSI